MAIRILIADDHEAVRLGLRAIFEGTEFEVVAEAASGKEAFQLALDQRPDVALLDVRMPNGDGLSCLARLKLDLPDTRVVMFSAYDNPTFIARAVALGAAGYLMKDTRREELLQCLRVAATGEMIWSRSKLRWTPKTGRADKVGNPLGGVALSGGSKDGTEATEFERSIQGEDSTGGVSWG